VTEHRRRHGHVGHAHAAEPQPDQAGQQALETVPDEGRPGAPAAERLERVPGAGIAVADLVEVHAVELGEVQRHRDRPEGVADNQREADSERHPCWRPSI